MVICSSGHEEVCFEDNVKCPACAVADEKEKEKELLQSDNDDLTDRVNDLETETKELETENIELSDKIAKFIFDENKGG